MDEQALNKKLAEWAELCWHDWKFSDHIDFNSLRLPNGKSMSNDGYLNRCIKCGASSDNKFKDIEGYNFTQSTDACFKWLVPKTVRELANIDLSTDREAMYKLFSLWIELFWSLREQPVSIALALCLAIEKLIDSEQSS